MPSKLVRVIVSKTHVSTMTLSGPTDEAILQDAHDITYVRRRSGLLEADLRTVEPEIDIEVLGDA